MSITSACLSETPVPAQPRPNGILQGAFNPGTRDPNFAIFFEATSRWDSQFDGLFLTVNKRVSHHFAFGVSYTLSKTIDDGPNPELRAHPAGQPESEAGTRAIRGRRAQPLRRQRHAAIAEDRASCSCAIGNSAPSSRCNRRSTSPFSRASIPTATSSATTIAWASKGATPSRATASRPWTRASRATFPSTRR